MLVYPALMRPTARGEYSPRWMGTQQGGCMSRSIDDVIARLVTTATSLYGDILARLQRRVPTHHRPRSSHCLPFVLPYPDKLADKSAMTLAAFNSNAGVSPLGRPFKWIDGAFKCSTTLIRLTFFTAASPKTIAVSTYGNSGLAHDVWCTFKLMKWDTIM